MNLQQVVGGGSVRPLPARSDLLQPMDNWAGYTRGRCDDPDLESLILRVCTDHSLTNRERQILTQRAMTSPQFPTALLSVGDRVLYSFYKMAPSRWLEILRVGSVKDFRAVERFPVSGADSRLPVVGESEKYLEGQMQEGDSVSFAVKKRGLVYKVSWEAFSNDDVGLFSRVMEFLSKSVTKTIDSYCTSLYFDENGPRTTFFSAANGGAAVGSSAFSPTAMKNAVGAMAEYTDREGDPIVVQPKYLMVPQSLMIQAMEVLQSIGQTFTVDTSGSGDGVAVAQPTKNALADFGIVLVVNPWIRSVVTSGTKGQTSWCLFTPPNEIPVGEFAWLQGHEGPQLLMRTEGMRPGDSFDSDSIQWRVRATFGAVALDGRGGWASVGQ